MRKAFPEAEVYKYEVRKSEPDRICLFPGGRAIFVELKRPGESLRDDQVRAFRRLHNLDFEAYWLPTRIKVDEFVQMLRKRRGDDGHIMG
jgi:hypothetical protein